jgi:AraC family transcriptional regulator, exoenzyme S synthesis regulatory protein ExsA
MMNMQEFIGNSQLFKQYKVDELLFAEFECPPEQYPANSWWHHNFFAFVLTGETVMKTPRGEYTLKAGDCAFAKKGTILISNHSQEVFCELVVFVPDEFIRNVIKKYNLPLVAAGEGQPSDTVIPLVPDDILVTYSHSLLAHFRAAVPPPASLLKLKFEELIVNILSNNNHMALKTYFSGLHAAAKPSIREIMETNFFTNLSLEEFARLCARSLSAFKQEFKNIYQTTPGKWLQEKRLEYARYLLETTDNTIEEICMETGFENRSHFIRVFKNKYGLPPGRMKTQMRAAMLNLA